MSQKDTTPRVPLHSWAGWAGVVLLMGMFGYHQSPTTAVAAKHNRPVYETPPKVYFSETKAHKKARMFAGPLPGMAAHPMKLAFRLVRAFERKGKRYTPRAHYFWTNRWPRFSNRLLFETSPYLLQHAHNPVNWYPWGKDAFARAKKENKPILLSVGYSTCHWCHVMERESFENKKIAAYMNRHYINIKVDREERLDVDGIYMRAVQIFSRGGGGWPMTVWLTPKREPFFGGTYFPPRDRWGRKGFLSMLKSMKERFVRDPQGVARQSRTMAWRLRNMAQLPVAKGVPSRSVLQRTAQLYNRQFDPVDGGRRGRPKFPSSFSSSFMFRYFRRTRDPRARFIAAFSLKKMGYGGIYDHVGGGFHRYSVDARWLVPHFEKMLYDNALLTVAYLDGYQVTRDPELARIAKEVLAYVMRERTSPQGGFYSATDADSEGHEGTFFLWRSTEIDRILGRRVSRWFKAFYNVTSRGNFEGKNILNIKRPMMQVARSFNVKLPVFRATMQAALKKLYNVRKKRIHPISDEKIITSWNGLMISAFARAGMVFRDPEYIRRAVRAANFLLKFSRRPNGRLYRTHKGGTSKFNAYLEDYAFFIAALLDLHEATQDIRWFKEALALQKILDAVYADPRGGYFRTSRDHEKLIFRPKPRYDGAVPTGNSIEAMNLMRLYTWTTHEKYRKAAEGIFRFFGRRLNRWPVALSEMVLALDFYHDAPKEIVFVKPHASSSIQPFLKRLSQVYLPNRVVLVTTVGAQQKKLQKWFPWIHKKKPIGGKVTAYVCKRRICELPTTRPEVFEKQIKKTSLLQFKRLQ